MRASVNGRRFAISCHLLYSFYMDTFLGSKLAILTAHPDDESYLCSGTVFENFKAGGTSFLVCASGGEKGTSHLKEPATEDELKIIRRQELKEAARIVHLDRFEIFEYPDSLLARHKTDIIKRAVSAISAFKPDYLLSFDKNGINGHLDHATIGRCAREVSLALRIPYFQFTFPPALMKHMQAVRKTRQSKGNYITEFTNLEPDIEIIIDGDVKMRALCAHKSQANTDDPLGDFPDEFKKVILSKEYFKKYEHRQSKFADRRFWRRLFLGSGSAVPPN